MECFEMTNSCYFSTVCLSNAGELSIRYNTGDEEIGLEGDPRDGAYLLEDLPDGLKTFFTYFKAIK